MQPLHNLFVPLHHEHLQSDSAYPLMWLSLLPVILVTPIYIYYTSHFFAEFFSVTHKHNIYIIQSAIKTNTLYIYIKHINNTRILIIIHNNYKFHLGDMLAIILACCLILLGPSLGWAAGLLLCLSWSNIQGCFLTNNYKTVLG